MEYSSAAKVSPGRLKLSLKKVITPFYGMKKEIPQQQAVIGSEDLISYYDLSSAFQRFCGPRKPKEDLSAFLTNVAATSNLKKQQDASCSLKHLVEKPPITGKDVLPLSSSAMVGFKMAAGPVPEQYQFFDSIPSDSALVNGMKERNSGNGEVELDENGRKRIKRSLDDYEEPAEKKSKKHRSGEEKEKKQKKKKKDKKKKKNDEEAGSSSKRVRAQDAYY
uniref:Mediator of RNA polymerase II transcription subunit 19 n=1 Tax=Bursaphelenchus xylophilus TaxID=6326 RepID=A0A1I7RYR3_BURXY